MSDRDQIKKSIHLMQKLIRQFQDADDMIHWGGKNDYYSNDAYDDDIWEDVFYIDTLTIVADACNRMENALFKSKKAIGDPKKQMQIAKELRKQLRSII